MLHVHKALTVHLTQKSVANEFVAGNDHCLESFSSNHIINFMCHCDYYNDIVKIILLNHEVLSISVCAPPVPCTMILLPLASIPSYGAATNTWMSNSLSPPVSKI